MIRGAVTKLDPNTCRLAPTRVGVYAESCADLIGSIASQGQIHPAIVRPTRPGDTHPYEIVCGVRRHFAVTYLRHRVDAEPCRTFLAHIRPLSDAEAFALADQDNRHRRDISDYQRALDYAEALDRHYAGNQGNMARRLCISAPDLSRYLSLANLPEPVFDAFGEPNRITLTHVRKLAPHLKDPARSARLLAEAAILAKQQATRSATYHGHLPASHVLHRLLEAADPQPILAAHEIHDEAGATLATGRLRPDGTIALTLAPAAALPELARILQLLRGTETCWNFQQ